MYIINTTEVGVATMVGQEDPELTSSHGYTRITATYTATVYKNHLQTSRKDFPQLKIQRKNHNEMGRRGRATVWSRPTPPGTGPTNRRITATAEVLSPTLAPNHRGLALETQAPTPEQLAFKASRAYVREPEDWGKQRLHPERECTKSHKL